ncbi:MAG TPA: hypothetical protein VE954_25880 [Oligoflexus sp.]|uniref:hypothetical protein n=1 Tax=Oligoflexus sp. TaxID=1971216 RepID=UPI002D2E7935|nr:hypothetical protein [Oligoflexus sp.]HYX36553.1 hypothetical protein [Oligoflexus sp.]
MKSKAPPKPHPSNNRRVPAHELFPQPGVYRPQSFGAKRSKRKRPLLLGLLFMLTFLAGFAALGYLRRPHMQAPFVLVELRAIEETGHPVTAAKVSINNKTMGVTDSFGEWRRYLRMHPGEQLSVELYKAGEPSYRGTRLLKVPKNRTGDHDFEVKASIEMVTPKALSKRKTKAPAPQRAQVVDETDPETPDEDYEQRRPEIKQKATVEVEERADPGDSNDSSMGLYFDDGLAAIALHVSPFRGVPANLLEKHQAEVLEDRILPMLANDLEALGIRVDKSAPWKLNLSYIPKRDQVGYIRSQITWQNPFGQPEKTAFVAGYAKTFEETVRAMSSLLRVHMKKSYWAFKEDGKWFIDESADVKPFWRLKPGMSLSDTNGLKFSIAMASQHDGTKRWKLNVGNSQPCATVRQKNRCMVSTQSLKEAPPLLGWKQRRLRIQGGLPKNAEVFVAGFQAVPVGDGHWEYWGHPGSNHKALVLSQGRIVHSEIFMDETSSLAVLRMPVPTANRQARR